MARLVLILLALGSVGSVHASPLIHFTMEGRKQGTDDLFTTNLQVDEGDLVEYRLRVDLDPPTRPYEQIPKNPLGSTFHGLNSLWLEIVQDPSDGIQVDFTSPATLTADSSPVAGDGWRSGTGARGGFPLLRDGTAWHDLDDIRPIHAPGIFTRGISETVLTGVFEVASLSGPSAQVRGRWRHYAGDPQNSGAFYWDGRLVFATRSTETGANPYSDYIPLTLSAIGFEAVPEPSTITLLAAMGGVLVTVLRLRRS